MARLRALLPRLNVKNDRQASFAPWETQGEAFDPDADDRGKSAGRVIPAEHVGRFAAILVGAMMLEGRQSDNVMYS